MTTARDLAQAIKSEVERAGARVSFGYSSKHRTAMLDNGHHTRHIIFSSTPSFGTAVDKVRADVRTTLRDMHRLREPVTVPEIVEPKLFSSKLLEPTRPRIVPKRLARTRAASMTPVGII